MPSFPWVPFGIAIFLATHGLRKKSLSPSGAFTALIVGFLIMAAPLKAFGISLIVFYLTGSRATKVGKERKASLEEGHMEAGYRDGWQVRWLFTPFADMSTQLLILTYRYFPTALRP